MKESICSVCRTRGIVTICQNVDYIYQEKGETKALPLCYPHSVELFKGGQISFMLKYNENLEELSSVQKKKSSSLGDYFNFTTFR